MTLIGQISYLYGQNLASEFIVTIIPALTDYFMHFNAFILLLESTIAVINKINHNQSKVMRIL